LFDHISKGEKENERKNRNRGRKQATNKTQTHKLQKTMALPKSDFGYNTTKSVHREARHMLLDRDKREKTRIEGRGPTSTNVLAESRVSAGYASNADRFSKDIPKELSKADVQAKTTKNTITVNRRQRGADRETDRWSKLEAEGTKARQDAAKLAGTGVRNNGSVGYNLLNGSWGNSNDAANAKYHDDRVEYAAKQRSANLDKKGNSSCYNVVTGEQRVKVAIPTIPQRPPQ
jgi:hypothetical protein